jgi:TRAP-type mannitol/chloroaromatic compound transport system substrate-binding protein
MGEVSVIKQKFSLRRRFTMPFGTTRRQFLGKMALGSAAATIGTLAMPNLSRAQTTVWRFQSSWPQKDIFHEIAHDYVMRVNSMAGSRLKLELLPAGAVVGAFQIQDAVHSGALEGGHAAVGYWYGKHKAFSMFGTTPPWGWDANMLLGWYYYGGGEALYRELVNDMIKVNVISFFSGPQPTQPLGWFKKEIHTAQELKGLKYRTIGLAADLFAEMEAAVTILPGGDIVPAMDRGLLDGAEFNNPSSDRVLGFPDVAKVYMLQSWHQRTETFEILFNKSKYEALPAELQAIIRYAAESSSADFSWKNQDRYSRDLEEMVQKHGVKAIQTPKEVLDAQLMAWDRVIARLSTDPFIKKIMDSQKSWVKRVGGFYHVYEADNRMAFDHFFKTV